MNPWPDSMPPPVEPEAPPWLALLLLAIAFAYACSHALGGAP